MKTSPNTVSKPQALKHQASKRQALKPQGSKSQTLTPQAGSSLLQDLAEMDTGFALLQSMMRSKTLTIMVIIFLLAGAAFALFLSKMAG